MGCHTAGPEEAHNIGVPCRLHKLNLQAGTRWRRDMDSRGRRWIRGVGGVAKPVNEGFGSTDYEVLVLHSASLSAVHAAASTAVQRSAHASRLYTHLTLKLHQHRLIHLQQLFLHHLQSHAEGNAISGRGRASSDMPQPINDGTSARHGM